MKNKKKLINLLLLFVIIWAVSCQERIEEGIPELNDEIESSKGVVSGGIIPLASTPDPLPGEYAFQHFFNTASLELENPGAANGTGFNFRWRNIKWLGGTANQLIEGSGGRNKFDQALPDFERIPYATWRASQINNYYFAARQTITGADILEHGPIRHSVMLYQKNANSLMRIFVLSNIVEYNDLSFNNINYPDGIGGSVINFEYDEVELGHPFIGPAGATYFVEVRVEAVSDPIGMASNMYDIIWPSMSLPSSTYVGLEETPSGKGSGPVDPDPDCEEGDGPCIVN